MRRAETGCGFFLLALEVFENRLHRTHDEGQTDERERDEHPERPEGHLHAERREPVADPAVFGIDGCEGDAGNRSRQRKRQIDDRIDDPPARERISDQDPGDEHPEYKVDEGGQRGSAEREPIRRQYARRRDGRDEARAVEGRRLEKRRGERDQNHEAQVSHRDAERHPESGQCARLAETEGRHAYRSYFDRAGRWRPLPAGAVAPAGRCTARRRRAAAICCCVLPCIARHVAAGVGLAGPGTRVYFG